MVQKEYKLTVKATITPVCCVRKTTYAQGSMSDEDWELFKKVLKEVVEELQEEWYQRDFD